MANHTITHAAGIYAGNANYAKYNTSAKVGRGVEASLPLYALLGAAIISDVDGICAAQAVAGAGALTIDGALASGGSVTLAVPQGIVIDSTNAGDTTQTITVTGTDYYDETLVEDIDANGTTAVSGLKAFKTITSVVSDAAFTGNVTVGNSNVLGLPFRTDDKNKLQVIFDGAADAATIVVADDNTATATTGDVRGTVTIAGTLDGTKKVSVNYLTLDRSSKELAFGVAQYAG